MKYLRTWNGKIIHESNKKTLNVFSIFVPLNFSIMSVQSQVMEQMKAAMKSKDTTSLEALRAGKYKRR